MARRRVLHGLHRKNVKKSSCLKPEGLESWYLVCSIIQWTSTKFIQIISLEPKTGLPQGYLVFSII